MTIPAHRRAILPAAALAALLSVQAAEPELPKEAQELIAKRNAAVQKVETTFIGELTKLMVKYTKNGDLETANEIAEIIRSHPFQIVEDGAATPSAMMKIAGKWVSDSDQSRWVFFEDGSGQLYPRHRTLGYDVKIHFDHSKQQYHVTWQDSKNIKEVFIYDEENDNIKMIFFGEQSTLTRLK